MTNNNDNNKHNNTNTNTNNSSNHNNSNNSNNNDDNTWVHMQTHLLPSHQNQHAQHCVAIRNTIRSRAFCISTTCMICTICTTRPMPTPVPTLGDSKCYLRKFN